MVAGEKRRALLVSLLLAAVTVATFSRVGGFGFLSYDDNGYITGNSMVSDGLSAAGIRWAFTAFHEANWHPLTWLSHMVDCRLFGLDPRGHHLVNLGLHTGNALLLFFLLQRLSIRFWQAAAVAFLFAVHPLHVESVAWVSERKDLLSALFFFLALHAYCRYADKPGVLRYLSVLLLFVCGLLSKPMVVTLPCVLLLLDWWPLGRVNRFSAARLFGEKIPFFALSLVSSVVTVLAQKKGDALTPLGSISLPERLTNVPVAYGRYLAKMVWPTDLAVFYPFAAPPLWQAAVGMLLLAAVTVILWRRRRSAPVALFGWLWYVGILVPVIGIVQVGEQAMADRYSYISLIGPFLMAAAGAGWGIRRLRLPPVAVGIGAAGLVVCLGCLSWRQSGYWKDSYTLFARATAVTANNYLATNNLGTLYAQQGLTAKGDEYYREALRMNPRYATSWYNLGVSLDGAGRFAEAERHFAEAARLKPAFAEAHFNLGVVLVKQGRLHESGPAFAEAVRLNPGFAEGHYNLGLVQAKEGRLREAAVSFAEALRLDSGNADARRNLAATMESLRNAPPP